MGKKKKQRTADFADGAKAPPRPEAAEVSSARLDYELFSNYLAYIENPNKLLAPGAASIQGQSLYADMMTDPHIYSVAQTRALSVASRDWAVKPSRKTGDAKAAEFVQDALTPVLTFGAVKELLTAIPRGYAVSEVLWDRGTALPVRLLGRRPERFVFDIDGNLRLLTKNSMHGEIMPPHKFIVHTFDGLYGNRYGSAALNSVYWFWWFKKHAFKFWVIFADKFGNPTVRGKYKMTASKEDKDNLLNAIRHLQNDTAFVIREDMEVDLLEAQRYGTTNTYKELKDACNGEISKAYLGQTLTVEQGKVGSFALGEVHNEVRHDLIEADARSLEAAVNELIGWICHFHGIQDAPYLEIDTSAEADLKSLAERDSILMKDLGVPAPKSYFYNTYNIPAPDSGDDLLAVPAQVVPAQTRPAPGGALASFSESDAADLAEYLSNRFHGLIGGDGAPLANRYELVRDAVRQTLEGADDYKAAAEAAGKLNIAAMMQRLMLPYLRKAALAGASAAADIVLLRRIGGSGAVDFADTEFGFDWAKGLAPEEAMAWWSEKIPATAAQLEKLEAAAIEQAFTVGGLESEYLTGKLHELIGEALEKGTPYGEWFAQVDGVFRAAGVDPMKPWRLETVLRTNMASAYNQGAKAVLDDERIAAEFPGYTHVTAGDSEVRPEHAQWDGFTAPREHPHWQSFFIDWSSDRYNCRCVFIPATQAEIDAWNAGGA